MSASLYLELPWQGKRQMFGDIAGFIIVTLFLVLIDSYILCEHQNTTRIIISIGIDYAILLVYIAARNVIMTSVPISPSGPAIPQSRAKYEECK
jgi:multisubunit Na+/H+ antiporter MnhC subunit